jgi:hypothetical protein
MIDIHGLSFPPFAIAIATIALCRWPFNDKRRFARLHHLALI